MYTYIGYTSRGVIGLGTIIIMSRPWHNIAQCMHNVYIHMLAQCKCASINIMAHAL